MKVSKEVKIGIFAVVCLAVLFWGTSFLKGRNVFSRTNVFYAVFQRVDGLQPTNDVILSGFKVGTVKSIKFEEGYTGRLIVSIILKKEYPVPLNSKISLISADLMGGKALRLDIEPSDQFHKSGDTLRATIETGLLDQLAFEMGPMKEKVENLMEGLDDVFDVLTDLFGEGNRANIDASLKSLKEGLDHMNSISKSIDGLLSEDEGKLYEMLKNVQSITEGIDNNMEHFQSIVQNFAEISDTIARANLSNTLAQVDSVMTEFNSTMSKINRGEGSMGLLINNDSLYVNLQDAAHNLDELLIDLKENPKRYVNISVFNFGRNKEKK